MSDGRRAAEPSPVSWLEHSADALPGLMWSTDVALRITSCHGRDVEQISQHPERLCGTSLFELFGTEDIGFPPIAAHRESLQGTNCPITFTLSGRAFRGVVAPLRTGGKTLGCVSVAFQQELLESRCHSICDTTGDLILFLQPDGTIEDVNRTATGSPRERVIGKSVFEFVPHADHGALRAALSQVVRTGRVEKLEVRFPRRFDSPAWHVMRIGPVWTSGKITGLVMLAQDITQQKQAVKKLEAEETLLHDLLELQDRERRLVAYEIHDGFIQDVVGARMILQGIRKSHIDDDPTLQKRTDTAVSLLARAINEGRRLISELRPMIIDEMGIVDAIDYLIGEEEARGGLEFHFVHRMQMDRLPALVQATLFRIVREAVTNARRHGRATQVDIRLTQIGIQDVIIEIQDDGTGFDPDQVRRDRFGLTGIRERARLFGGGATIESAPGKGTRITVKVALDTPRDVAHMEQPDWTWTV